MTNDFETPLIPDQRREEIMRLLHRDGVLSVVQLTEALGVSHMTIRRDIAMLEREGRAFSIAGGARLASGMRHEPAFSTKVVSEPEEKAAIAACAERLLRDEMAVYLDAGTTTGAIVPAIRARSGMTVITNDFAIVDALTGADHVEVIHVGGRLDHANRSTVGRLAAETLRRINTDVAFISASSWDIGRGLTTPAEPKVDVKLAAIEAASECVLVATSSKFGTFGMYDVVPLRRFDRIVTDARIAPAAAAGIRDLGVTLEIAESAAVP
ncbi:DeoR/GlpR family DNA-binding transcription regulator [Compostimonas suwonensis]|uniref:DeoR/GlpR family transcriptional regulator of sugar metabolism n=1 Tax=Compostimonas suwonensis TaxID=1048394 RepID=A0A2M9BZE3_9MICO|nr:DeoR/GlpR family DNA-binding transcription regulator [Compostimonas suwonensis]PJJ63455.1 DeoR/GlpR family transcriptional regulator of sugar metabolism [Compostimonas suwonensis]